VQLKAGASMGVVTVGGCHGACLEALDLLAKDGVSLDYMRVRGFPFGDDVRRFLEQHEMNFVSSRIVTAQLRSLLMLETGVAVEKMESIRYYGGFPMSAHHVISGVKRKLERAAKKDVSFVVSFSAKRTVPLWHEARFELRTGNGDDSKAT
jgi:2-oxoglutarate ferredoxin oxidoreductase subunit alpha